MSVVVPKLGDAKPDDLRRLQRKAEASMIEQALADVAAGRLVDAADVDAWIDSVGTDHERPVPQSGK